jgi:hypothetical protein
MFTPAPQRGDESESMVRVGCERAGMGGARCCSLGFRLVFASFALRQQHNVSTAPRLGLARAAHPRLGSGAAGNAFPSAQISNLFAEKEG